MNEQPEKSFTQQRSKRKRIIIRWVKLAIIIYSAVGIILYYLQETFLFHPEILPFSYVYNFNKPFKEINIDVNKNDILNLVQFFPSGSVKKGIVIYFHGNMKNINWYAKYSDNFTKQGYEIWMIDYPGFGKSTGELTEANLYRYAELVYRLARSKMSSDSIIIYGKSLGTGIAAELASLRPCKMLILETPYYSIPALFSTYAPIYPNGPMSHFKLPTAEYLKSVTAPVIIFHGTADDVISYNSAYRLKNFLKPNDKFISIHAGNHNNLNDFEIFHKTLDSLLSK